jgi:hypothetical protein
MWRSHRKQAVRTQKNRCANTGVGWFKAGSLFTHTREAADD